ncbi:hypothetical protein, partial [Klebsiella pneumoniae]|uniref:hypothetical protein n=1 Tax=Klebsiella pneumoniae TaxID=573 RepID=UPI001954D4AF
PTSALAKRSASALVGLSVWEGAIADPVQKGACAIMAARRGVVIWEDQAAALGGQRACPLVQNRRRPQRPAWNSIALRDC